MTNAQHQRKFRERMRENGFSQITIYVPTRFVALDLRDAFLDVDATDEFVGIAVRGRNGQLRTAKP